MDSTLPSLETVLSKLPWYGDLTEEHRDDLSSSVEELMADGSTRGQYEALLVHFGSIAQVDARWARFDLLRESSHFAP
jgi:hypothetical protein